MKLHSETSTPVAISSETMVRLEEFRSTFKMGHTDDDARRVLRRVREITGRHFAILWDFNDCWGLGGNSEMVEIDGDGGRLREAPCAWCEFLYEEGNAVAADELSEARAGRVHPHWKAIHCEDDFNFYRRAVKGEAS
jgi:hypothetical protein